MEKDVEKLMSLRSNWSLQDYKDAYENEWDTIPNNLDECREQMSEYINMTYDRSYINECIQEESFYYEIHVAGRNSFSTSVVSEIELDDSDVILLAYEQDKLEGDDCHYVDYINPLSFDEWNTHFNF